MKGFVFVYRPTLKESEKNNDNVEMVSCDNKGSRLVIEKTKPVSLLKR